jgi:hypothetical protein
MQNFSNEVIAKAVGSIDNLFAEYRKTSTWKKHFGGSHRKKLDNLLEMNKVTGEQILKYLYKLNRIKIFTESEYTKFLKLVIDINSLDLPTFLYGCLRTDETMNNWYPFGKVFLKLSDDNGVSCRHYNSDWLRVRH